MNKVKVKLVGEDGNVFYIIGAECNSYDEVLQLVMKTVDVE